MFYKPETGEKFTSYLEFEDDLTGFVPPANTPIAERFEGKGYFKLNTKKYTESYDENTHKLVVSDEVIEEQCSKIVPYFQSEVDEEGNETFVKTTREIPHTKYYLKEVLEPLNGEELATKARVASMHAKNKRNTLLNKTDWVVTKSLELGEPVPDAWTTYRQALRDIPSQAGFPHNIEWPTEPE